MENRHYFTQNNDDLASEPKIIHAKIMGESYQFKTDNGVFSKDYLDYATKILLENLTLPEVEGDILDVGCGYGPIGIFLAKKSGKKASVTVNVTTLVKSVAITGSHYIINGKALCA